MVRPSLLSKEEVESALVQLDGWHERPSSTGSATEQEGDSRGGTSLAREFQFENFTVAFGFMASIATVAERLGHHPDWANSYNRVTIGLTTHDVGGITTLDIELAHEISRLARRLLCP